MSGHSKWAQIKRGKAVLDKKKGQLFSKLAREISIAAKTGGDPSMNFKLRMAMDKAKSISMPQSNIDRAIKRGTGEDGAGTIEEMVYEGYGPFGTAFLVETATDNTNRTVNEIKNIFHKHGGHLGAVGSVAWQFVTRGQILVERDGRGDLSEIELSAIDAGAEDVRESPEGLEIYTTPLDLNKVREATTVAGGKIAQAQIIKEGTQGIDLSEAQKPSVDTLFAVLEEHDDVIAVHTSANL